MRGRVREGGTYEGEAEHAGADDGVEEVADAADQRGRPFSLGGVPLHVLPWPAQEWGRGVRFVDVAGLIDGYCRAGHGTD